MYRPAVSRNAPEPPKVKMAEPVTTGGKKRKITQVTVSLTQAQYNWTKQLATQYHRTKQLATYTVSLDKITFLVHIYKNLQQATKQNF